MLLQAAREKGNILHNGIATILITDFSSDMMVARGQGVKFNVLKVGGGAH